MGRAGCGSSSASSCRYRCRRSGLLALFTFIGQWNNFLWPLIIASNNDMATLPLGLLLFKTQQGTAWNYIMAGATFSMLPGIVLAVLLQRFIFKSISIGSGFGGR